MRSCGRLGATTSTEWDVLEGRVAVITGAGRGLGREHALLFASLGAKVVVNDIGSGADGSGTDGSAAEAVVAEIRAGGGQAIADSHSVTGFTDAGLLVQKTIDTFGDLHVVVNNAGILRDKMLVSMSEADFDDVIAVHLKGTFNVTRHAAEYWRSKAKGVDQPIERAVVHTSSGSGLQGNVGQTNYASAKAAIAGMTLVHAPELKRYGVRVNTIAPIARTRLTMQTPGLNERMAGAEWDPANVSPLVAYLSSERCRFTGQTFSAYGSSVHMYCPWSTIHQVSTTGRWAVHELGDAMETTFPLRATPRSPFQSAMQEA
jgi:NAD(P)-dependent dehydrogenase (short-subunit alcohol dehydrogenase family)